MATRREVELPKIKREIPEFLRRNPLVTFGPDGWVEFVTTGKINYHGSKEYVKAAKKRDKEAVDNWLIAVGLKEKRQIKKKNK